jgi:hypothetical protein
VHGPGILAYPSGFLKVQNGETANMPSMKRTPLVTIPLVLAIAVAGCGTKSVSKEEVEKQVQAYFDNLAKQNGQTKFPDIKCPDDLEAKKGKSERCSAKGTDGTLGITVTVTDVSGDKASLSFKADDKLNQ